MKNKGFTLIELLAVIVILAIIALIATPMILNVVDKAKEGSAKNAALYYVEAVENSVLLDQLDGNTVELNGEFKVSESGKKLTKDSKVINVSFKGDAPTDNGTVTFTDGVITGASLEFSKIVSGKTVTVSADRTATIS